MEKTGDLISQRQIRLDKVKELKKRGFKPYPTKVAQKNSTAEITGNFDKFENKEVNVAGRLMTWREHGKLIFGDLQDATGQIQLYIKKDEINKFDTETQNLGWKNLDLLDIGDIVKVSGTATKTKRGEISVLVKDIRIATKAIRPLPEKWAGLKDKELRFRRRYLDMTMNTEIRERFQRRSKFWEATRNFLNKKGFTEINIPILEHVTGGADAKPFITNFDALDQDLYLRISHELPLKRLLGAGFEKVYDIGARFRNEGIDDEHLPEHVAMEFYWAYSNYKDGMKLTEEMYKYILKETFGKTKFEINGMVVDINQEWEEWDFEETLKKHYSDDLDIYNDSIEELAEILEKHGGEVPETLSRGRVVDHLWKVIRKDIAGPIFLTGIPKFFSPLAKSDPEDPEMAQRFYVIAAGSEICNAFSELNDPVDQLERFVEQQRLRESGDDEAQMLDIDFVEMLEYGMPPAFGFGMSERVFWMFEGVSAKEGVPFPQLKYDLDDNTSEIYEDIKDLIKAPHQNTKKDKQEIDLSNLPSRQEAIELLKEHVSDKYQLYHAEMVAKAMEAYAEKYEGDPDLWYITGLLHDLDYDEHPEDHPFKSLDWLREAGYPEEMTNAIGFHSPVKRDEFDSSSKLAQALLAIDELTGIIYAYALMRPQGFEGMKGSKINKKFKDKAFAAKIDRDEIKEGTNLLGIEMSEHMQNLADIFQSMEAKKF